MKENAEERITIDKWFFQGTMFDVEHIQYLKGDFGSSDS